MCLVAMSRWHGAPFRILQLGICCPSLQPDDSARTEVFEPASTQSARAAGFIPAAGRPSYTSTDGRAVSGARSGRDRRAREAEHPTGRRLILACSIHDHDCAAEDRRRSDPRPLRRQCGHRRALVVLFANWPARGSVSLKTTCSTTHCARPGA